MPDGVDGGAEYQIFDAAMAVRGHHQKVGLHFFDNCCNLLGGSLPMTNEYLNAHILIVQDVHDAREILRTFGYLRG